MKQQREIKFKAWDKIDNKIREIKKFVLINNKICAIEFDNYAKGDYPQGIKYCNIMQYTGLKDKNGKEIYEGDIVYSQVNREGKCRVIFKNGAFGYFGEEEIFYGFNERNIYLEVIGNIYENPNLLK